MTAAPVMLVLDASAGAKLFLHEPDSIWAQSLVERHVAEPAAVRVLVPDLFYVECANVLWKHVQRGLRTADQARKDVVELAALRFRTVPTAELVVDALRLGLTWGVTAYDACYVALAARERATVVTADERLAARLAGGPVRVVLLRDAASLLPPE